MASQDHLDGAVHDMPRKISETLLEFASPILAHVPRTATVQEFEQVLSIAFVVWNAVILDKVHHGSKYLEQARATVACQPQAAAMIETLVTRKRTLFANDDRLIGDYRMIRKQGRLHLRAEARDPHTMPHAHPKPSDDSPSA